MREDVFNVDFPETNDKGIYSYKPPERKPNLIRPPGRLKRKEITTEEIVALENNYSNVYEDNKECYKRKRKRKKSETLKEFAAAGIMQSNLSPPKNPAKRSEKKVDDIDEAVKFIKSNYNILVVAGKHIFVFNGKYYEDITDRTVAVRFLKAALNESSNRSFRDYTEIYKQLLSEPKLSCDSWDSITRNRDVIVFQNGTYDVRTGILHVNEFFPDDYVFSICRFEYNPDEVRQSEIVDHFVDYFTNSQPDREDLLYEILGYCLSNYENKKAGFYFDGVPDAGKSSLCRFIETAVGEDAYISIAIKELSSRFASGDLFGAKVVADEDVAVDKALRSEDISLIKKITSSDKIRTEAKFKNAEQLRPDCKLIWAGNGMPKFSTSEDLEAFFNRLVVFPLERAVPVEERDPDIVSKLVSERNYIIHRALQGLRRLVNNDFQFTKVVDAKEYISSENFENGVEAFVEESCILREDLWCETSVLHEAYRAFCMSNPRFEELSINPFSAYILKKYGLKRQRSSQRRGLSGICLLSSVDNATENFEVNQYSQEIQDVFGKDY